MSQIYDCINKGRYTEEESILETSILDKAGMKIDDKELAWTKDIKATILGNCYTLIYKGSTSPPLESIRVILNDTMKYYLLIHDKDFFILNSNILAFSKDYRLLDGKFFLI